MNLEFNKIAGAILLGGVIAMTSGTIAKMAFGGYSHHHEGEEEKRGYEIEVTEDAGAGGAPAVEIDMGTLLAAATVEQGANVVKKCVACHDFTQGGPNKVGPNLYGVLGGPHAHKADFQYSDVMKSKHGEKWDVDSLWHFLNNPAGYMKGTKMSFAGLKKPEELAAAIVYIRSLGSTGVPLPAPKPVAAAVPVQK
jgi:cytochrome c